MRKQFITKLASVFLAALMLVSAVSIGELSFSTQAAEFGDYTYEVSEDGTAITITKYNGSDTQITIPSEIDGLPVTKIGSAFKFCESLTEITIPDSIASISLFAFDGCTSLKNIFVTEDNTVYSSVDGVLLSKDNSVLIRCPEGRKDTYTIPDSVTSIGRFAFDSCTSLTDITIPDSIASIGEYAFFGCTSLTEITIPNGVTSIGECAFFGCTSLKNIFVTEYNTIYSSVDGVLLSKDKSKLIEFPKGKKGAYTIPDSVTDISSYTFENCTSLTNITIPDSVTSIGSYAFSGCTSLTEITIPNGVTAIGKGAFEYCTSLTNINIPNSVTDISEYAFSSCTSLTEITIPNSVTSIGESAFESCTSLTEITIPDSVILIDGWAFYNCTSLENIYVAEENKDYSSVDGVLLSKGKDKLIQFPGGKKGAYTIPDSVTLIDDWAFCDCISLTDITIPDSVTLICEYAFSGCTSLTDITIPDSVTSIHSYAFFSCANLTEITIPSSVTSIGSGAFSRCANLAKITILNPNTVLRGDGGSSIEKETTIYGYKNSTAQAYAEENGNEFVEIDLDPSTPWNYSYKVSEDGTAITITKYTGSDTQITIPSEIDGLPVTVIGGWAFNGCTNLTNINIPNSVTDISEYAFSSCTSLTEITIPDSVTSIGASAFECCTSLTNITIPNGVTSIGFSTFRYCTSLTEITIPDSVTSISNSAFKDCNSLENIYVAEENKDYSSVDGVLLSKGKDKLIQFPRGKKGAYTIPDSVTLIDDLAFESCTSLTEITIPNGVTSIGALAFENCASLTEIIIPNSVTSIGARAFSSCTSLTEITISDSVTSIGAWAFESCTSLTEITIPDSVTSIGGWAFSGCDNLAKITILNPNALLGSASIPKTAKIYGVKNSTAQAYAEENGNEFVTLEGETPTNPTEPTEPTDPLPENVIRISGQSRIGTANSIALQGWDSAETVVLANSMNFADALAGSPLAAAYDAPMLLTLPKTLDSSVLETIKTLGAKNIIILGGVGAINENIETELKASGYSVTRIAGQSRYETAVKIAEALAEKTGVTTFENVFIADGGNFPDALAASPVAAINGAPILFTYSAKTAAGDTIDPYTSEYISKIKPDTAIILGGTGAISQTAMDIIGTKNSKRLFGNSRYETAVAIYKEFKDMFDADVITIATGADFPDALAGSAYAAKLKAPVILVDNKNIVETVKNTIVDAEPDTIVVFGGSGVVSNETVNKYSK